MAFPYRGVNNKKTRKAPKGNGKMGKFPKKKASPRHILGVLAALFWLAALILGAFTLVGCISPSMEKLYVADLATNDTYAVNFRVGFFGGCLSMTNTTSGPSISADTGGESAHTQCVTNMRIKDNDDLSDQLLDDWSVTEAAAAELKSSLNKTLDLARHLQNDVFPASPPTTHVVFLLISGILLFALSTNPSGKRGYKMMLVAGVLMGAFALALVYLASMGALRSLNALVDGDWEIERQSLGGNGVTVQRAGRLWYVQLAQLVLVSAFYVFMGMMFV